MDGDKAIPLKTGLILFPLSARTFCVNMQIRTNILLASAKVNPIIQNCRYQIDNFMKCFRFAMTIIWKDDLVEIRD